MLIRELLRDVAAGVVSGLVAAVLLAALIAFFPSTTRADMRNPDATWTQTHADGGRRNPDTDDLWKPDA